MVDTRKEVKEYFSQALNFLLPSAWQYEAKDDSSWGTQKEDNQGLYNCQTGGAGGGRSGGSAVGHTRNRVRTGKVWRRKINARKKI